VNAGTLVHTDSGGDFPVAHARESDVRQLGDRVLIDTHADRPPPRPRTMPVITGVEARTDLTMSIRA
jgi:hypothetical protein